MNITLGPAAAELARNAADAAGVPVEAWIDQLIVNHVQAARRETVDLASAIKALERTDFGPTMTVAQLAWLVEWTTETHDGTDELRERLAERPFEVTPEHKPLPDSDDGLTVYNLNELYAACQRVLRQAEESFGIL